MFWLKRRLHRRAAVFDLAGMQVAGALVEQNGESIPRTLSFYREPVGVSIPFDFQKCIDTLPERVRMIREQFGVDGAKVDDVLFVLSAPHYLAQTRVVKQGSTTPELLSSTFLRAKSEETQNSFIGEHRDSFARISRGEPISLETNLLKSVLNGYPVSDPVGRRVSKTELSFFTSMYSRELEQALHTSCEQVWPSVVPQAHSFPFIAFRALNALFPSLDNYTIINIGADYSEVIIVWNDEPAEVTLIPIGESRYIGALAEAFGGDVALALSTLALYARGEATPEAAAQVETITRQVEEEWVAAFSQVAKQILEDLFLPERVYIVSRNPSISLVMAKLFSSQSFSKLSVQDTSFSVRTLHMSGEVQGGRTFLDDPLILASVFYATMG